MGSAGMPTAVYIVSAVALLIVSLTVAFLVVFTVIGETQYRRQQDGLQKKLDGIRDGRQR